MDTMIPDCGDGPRPETDAERQARLAWEAVSIQAAIDSLNAGYYVTSEEMDAWIDSIGTDHEILPPNPLHPRPL